MSEKVTSSNNVKEFSGPMLSFAQFSKLTKTSKQPFIIRNCQFFDHQQTTQTFEAQATNLSYYDPESELYRYQTVREVQREFQTKSLTKNHFDTPVDFLGILPEEWQSEARERLVEPETNKKHGKNTLTWIWTAPDSVTGFHHDPVYGQISGAWMWLVEGQKCWWFLDPELLKSDEQSRKKTNELDLFSLNKMTASTLLERGFPILGGEIGKNDLLWFPNGWIHRVETSEWSFGFGGYF